jgi:hypothetical protein
MVVFLPITPIKFILSRSQIAPSEAWYGVDHKEMKKSQKLQSGRRFGRLIWTQLTWKWCGWWRMKNYWSKLPIMKSTCCRHTLVGIQCSRIRMRLQLSTTFPQGMGGFEGAKGGQFWKLDGDQNGR